MKSEAAAVIQVGDTEPGRGQGVEEARSVETRMGSGNIQDA